MEKEIQCLSSASSQWTPARCASLLPWLPSSSASLVGPSSTLAGVPAFLPRGALAGDLAVEAAPGAVVRSVPSDRD